MKYETLASSDSENDVFEQLPFEVIVHILSFLDSIQNMASLARVSRFWKNITESNAVWKKIGDKLGISNLKLSNLPLNIKVPPIKEQIKAVFQEADALTAIYSPEILLTLGGVVKAASLPLFEPAQDLIINFGKILPSSVKGHKIMRGTKGIVAHYTVTKALYSKNTHYFLFSVKEKKRQNVTQEGSPRRDVYIVWQDTRRLYIRNSIGWMYSSERDSAQKLYTYVENLVQDKVSPSEPLFFGYPAMELTDQSEFDDERGARPKY